MHLTQHTFESRLRMAMKQQACDAASLSRLTGISQTCLSRYLRGRIPRAIELFTLARSLRVTMEWLLVGEDNVTAPAKGPSQTVLVHLTPDTRARVTITVEQDGLGAIDPPVRRAPTLSDFEAITRQLSDRKYELTKP